MQSGRSVIGRLRACPALRLTTKVVPAALDGLACGRRHLSSAGALDIDHIMALSDNDEEDIKRAIALSLAPQEPLDNESTENAVTTADVKPPSVHASTGFLGLNRQAMEQERLARLTSRKRDRSISPPLISRKAPKLEQTTVELPSGARLNMFSSIVQQDQRSRKSEAANEATGRLRKQPTTDVKDEFVDGVANRPPTSAPVACRYPNGVLKKTWAFGHDRTGDEIKLEEVLEAITLRTAVMSAFQWDTDWVLAKLKIPPNGGTTKCVFIMQAKDESMRQRMREESEGMRSFLRLCFPPMEGQVHCMHSKLMLLFHPEKLRIAIPSANLLNFDWGETGMMENSVFMIDLPRLPDASKVDVADLTFFGKELMYFLDKQGLDQDVKDGVLNFDFSATSEMAFVHTVGGVLYREEAERTGLPGLGRAVRHLALQTDDLEIDFAASSIGSLNDDQLRNLHSAAKGEDLIALASTALTKTKADFFKPSANKAPSKSSSIRDKIRIYFPTHATVKSSTAGGAGTICLSRKWYENMPFPRASFRDYVSVRPGLLSHNKILYARGKRKSDGNKTAHDVAWVYHGSANMSESAWGKLLYDKKDKAWKINCRNWECGVLLPVPAEKLAAVKTETPLVKKEQFESEDSETESEGEEVEMKATLVPRELVGMEVFKGLADLPFEYPGADYSSGQEPWYFQER